MLKYKDYKRLEDFLQENFLFRANEVRGSIEFKTRSDEKGWQELNEFDVYRQLKLSKLNVTLNELIYLLKSDFVPVFNPIVEYFNSLGNWDSLQPDYIDGLCSYIKSPDAQRITHHFKKWFIRSVKCALEDDFINKNALILVHEKQNSGKTTFIRFLCPSALRGYFTENIGMDKDSMIALIENFIINLDELATFTRLEINGLKSIISKSFVKARHPFERKAKRLPRRASFIGSTNMTEFLTDPTGNVRWIPFEISGIDWNYSKEININDVWRQAYYLYKTGSQCEINAEELRENELANKAFTVVTPEMELITKYYDLGSKEDYDSFLTTTEIESDLLKRADSFVKVSNWQLGKALKMLGFQKGNRYSDKKSYPIKAYYLKNK